MTASGLVGIFGSGRNGSTLISRLLDGIPGSYMHPVEANFLSAADDLAILPLVRRKTIQNAVVHPLKRLDRPVATKRLLSFYGAHFREIENGYLPELDPGAIRFGRPPAEQLVAKRHYRPAEFVPAFLRASAEWLGQDAPSLSFFKSIETPYIADYERLFPEMRFIHIVRDPVDTWASAKRSLVNHKGLPPWYLGRDSFRVTMECRWVPHAEAILARRGDERHFIVRYEDLVKNAAGKVAEICAWLGVPPPRDPDTQTLLGGHHPRKVQNNPSQKGVETPRRAVADLHQRFAFDPVVTERERNFIRLRTRMLAGPLGYAVEPPADPRAVRNAWFGMDEWDFKHTSGAKSWLLSLYCFVEKRLYVWRQCANAASVRA